MKLLKIPKILKKKKVFIPLIIVVLVILGVWLSLEAPPIDPPISGIILFEGENCKQCDNVDKFIKNNKVEEKITFTRLEVFNDPINANLLASKAEICGLNVDQIGVPFLWDGEKCVIGYIDVISYLRNKINEK